MSTYHPSPEALKRDASMLQKILARALRRLDERDVPAANRRMEETFIGHCYEVDSGRRSAAR